jgi:hypothetical protein
LLLLPSHLLPPAAAVTYCRFTNWTKAECLVEDCTEAATRVDIVVDLQALQAQLDSRLPLVFGGASVKAAALPWPKAL